MKVFLKRHDCLSAFLLGFILFTAALLPALIMRGGFFYYYGDYNYQSIEFYTYAHRAIKEGYLFWNPLLEWGGTLVGSLGSYAVSPFLMLLLPFPNEWIPYLLPLLMAIRYGVATMTSYAWLRTVVKTKRMALFGALIYSFSGFQAINIVFSSFHDITAFFPVYLLSFDRLMKEGKKTGFILMTALLSSISLYSFYGMVIFFLIYYFTRYFRPWDLRSKWRSEKEKERRRTNLKRFLLAAFTGIVGVMIAAVIIICAVQGLFGNTRIGKNVAGESIFAFSNSTTIWAIFKSLFFIPEQMGYQSFFYNGEYDWSSMSLYLPLVSISGIIAFFALKKGKWKKEWLGRVFVVLLVFSLVNGLNAAFSAFNNDYFARWFYMFTLILAAMSAKAYEEVYCFNGTRNSRRTENALRKGAVFVLVMTVLFSSVSIISDNFYLYIIAASVVGAIILLFIVFLHPSSRLLVVLLSCFCAFSTGTVVFAGFQMTSPIISKNFREHVLNDDPGLDMTAFSRVEDDASNRPIVWGYAPSEAFISTPSPSVFSVFKNLQTERMMTSHVDRDERGLRALLSTRYYLYRNLSFEENSPRIIREPDTGSTDENGMRTDTDSKEDSIPRYFKYQGDNDGFSIYENEYFIPMGFTFESFVRESEIREILYPDDDKSELKQYNLLKADSLLVKDLILSDEQAEKYSDLLAHDSQERWLTLDDSEFKSECKRRAESACSEFSYDPEGYTAKIFLDRKNLVFFSIPYDKGFKAYVDGEETVVEKVDYGFMAVPVSSGEHEIRFVYRPYGFNIAVICTILGIVITLLLFLYDRRKSYKNITEVLTDVNKG